MEIDGSTKIVGILGYPIKHTISPSMHNVAFRALHLNWVYLPFEVKPQKLEEAVKAIVPLNIQGVNVTIPYKRDVVPLLDELSPEAKMIGAVNTIVNKHHQMIGYNTDGRGFSEALKEEEVSVGEKNILILGAGGAAYAITYQLLLEGAKSIKIANRTLRKAEDLKRKLLKKPFSKNVEILPLEPSRLKGAIKDVHILINATSVGMRREDQTLINEEWLGSPLKTVIDLIYNPPLTPLLKMAKKGGLKIVNGLSMLLHQGALSFELWTDKKAPLEVMRKTLYEQLKIK